MRSPIVHPAISPIKACSTYMEQFLCKALGFGDEVAGDTNTFYTPDDLPKNRTKPLFNTGGVISSPISGATWTFGTIEHAITVSSTDYVATATVTGASGGSVSSGSTATETGASATSTSLAAGSGVPALAIVGPVIAIVYGL